MQPTGWLSKPSVSTMQLVRIRVSPRSKRDSGSPLPGGHVATDHFGGMTRRAERLSHGCGMIDRGAEEDRLPVGSLFFPMLDYGIGQHGPVQNPVGSAHVEIARCRVEPRQFVAQAA